MKANELKLNKKELNAASKGIAKANNAAKKAMKQDRKTLRATVAYIATTDTDECANFRAFLNLKKNANKQERNNVCSWVQKRYLYVTTKYVVTTHADAVEVENYGVMPCSKNGKIYTDMLDAITAVKTAYEKTITARREVARQMWVTRKNLIGKNDYLPRVQNVLNLRLNAPAKLQRQIILPDTIIRK